MKPDMPVFAARAIGTRFSTARTTLAGRYWFSERFGMEVPIYSETVEQKDTLFGVEQTTKVTNTGIGLYAAFRF
jgi:hypothetical protein